MQIGLANENSLFDVEEVFKHTEYVERFSFFIQSPWGEIEPRTGMEWKTVPNDTAKMVNESH